MLCDLTCFVLKMREGETLRQAGKITSQSVVNIDVVLSFCFCWVWFLCIWLSHIGNERLHFCLNCCSYQFRPVQVALSSMKFLELVSLSFLYVSPDMRYKMFPDVIRWFDIVFHGIFSYQQTTYVSDGTDPMRCAMLLTVCSRIGAIWLLEILHLLNWDVGTFEAELACGCVRV